MQPIQSQRFFEQASRNNRRGRVLGLTGLIVLVLMMILLGFSLMT